MFVARVRFDQLTCSLEVAERKLAEKDAAILRLKGLVEHHRDEHPDTPVPVQPATGDARLLQKLELLKRANRQLDQTSRDLHWTTVIQEREIVQLREQLAELQAAAEQSGVAS